MATSAIPEDILIEILSRLPVKSLLCYKSVSKYWNSLIQSPALIKVQQRHSQVTKENASLFVLRSSRHPLPPTDTRYFETICTFFRAGTLTPITDIDYYELPSVTYPKGEPNSLIRLYGPCNGIICILDLRDNGQHYFVLCNPATREFKTLQNPPFSYPGNKKPWKVLIGFGFDEIGNDYKLVRVVRLRTRHHDDYTPFWDWDSFGLWKVEMYSLRDDTWKEVDVELPFSSDFFTCSKITYANICHWLGYETMYEEDEIDWCMYILVFDMVEEAFRKIQLTEEIDFFQGVDNCRIELMIYDGSLALIKYDFIPEYSFHLWVMREYGVLESWEKIHMGHFNDIYRPLASRNADELLLESSHGDMVLFDLATEGIAATGLSGMPKTFRVIIFQECLTSIKEYSGA